MDKKEITRYDLEKAKRLRNVRNSHHLTQEKWRRGWTLHTPFIREWKVEGITLRLRI